MTPFLTISVSISTPRIFDATIKSGSSLQRYINSQEVVAETNSNDQTLSPESPNQLLDPKLPLNMNSFLNNPSIAVHPQHASQVNLGTVQNLEAVFDNVYNSNNEGQAVRRSGRNRAEHDYRAMHHGK